MYRAFLKVGLCVFAIILSLSNACAMPMSSAMREGAYALPPFSFTRFCVDYPSECSLADGRTRVELTTGRMSDLAAVNRLVNSTITPKADTSHLRYWKLNVTSGDCNSFAIQKRHELLARGWPAGALALSAVMTAWGEGHMVLTVRTDRGDFVLDNLRSQIIGWRQTGYRWIMRQSEDNPQFWVDLHGGQIASLSDVRHTTGRAIAADGARVDNRRVVSAPVRPTAQGATAVSRTLTAAAEADLTSANPNPRPLSVRVTDMPNRFPAWM